MSTPPFITSICSAILEALRSDSVRLGSFDFFEFQITRDDLIKALEEYEFFRFHTDIRSSISFGMVNEIVEMSLLSILNEYNLTSKTNKRSHSQIEKMIKLIETRRLTAISKLPLQMTKEYAKNRTLIRTRWTQQIGSAKGHQELDDRSTIDPTPDRSVPASVPVTSTSTSSPPKKQALAIDSRVVEDVMQDAMQAYSITMLQMQDEWKTKYQQLQLETSNHIRDLQNAITFHIKQENDLRTQLEVEKARNEALSSRLDVLVNEYAAEVAMNAENLAKLQLKST
jgi:hypothetical protein